MAAFVAVTSGLVFLLVKATAGLRVSEQEEIEGLDVHEHGIAGYPDFAFGAGGSSRSAASATYGFVASQPAPSTTLADE